MYTLRRISGRNIEMNYELGKSYTVVHRYISYDEFARDFEHYFKKMHVADNDPTSDDDTKRVFAFVIGEDASYIQPLYNNQQNYIMTSEGRTFSKIAP